MNTFAFLPNFKDRAITTELFKTEFAADDINTESDRFRDGVFFSIIDKGMTCDRGTSERQSMKSFFSCMVLFAAAALVWGCSSAEVSSNGSNTNRVQNSAAVSNAANAPQTAGANMGEPQNSVPANVQTSTNRLLGKIERMRAEAAKNPTTGKQKSTPRQAPEDSVVYTELTDAARELRIWNKHPQLLKVLKTHDGSGGSVKVYLRDGRVFDMPGKSIVYLDQTSSTSILQMVGVTPQVPGQKRSAPPAGPKKGEN